MAHTSKASQSTDDQSQPAKRVPEGASKLTSRLPFSPVLEIQADRLFVVSGQAAIDADGNIIGHDIESQTRATLDHCQRVLESAGCTFHDVFKVNAYLTSLDDWDGFNAVYREVIPEPRPARTTINARPPREGLLIEIEMWAAKRS